jgi:hypothetical protein
MPEPITFDTLNAINVVLQDRNARANVKACGMLLDSLGVKARPKDGTESLRVIHKFFYGQLEQENYLAAGTLLFGFNYFDPRPAHVQRIFTLSSQYPRLSFCGASSMSKTYSLAIWLVLDFLRDPDYTKIRVGSTNKEHLESVVFSDIRRTVQASVLDTGLETESLWIGKKSGVKEKNRDHCIKGVIFPQDQNFSTGRFRGLHPSRRLKEHAKFGQLGRVRLLLDEASSIPGGVFKDLGSVESSVMGPNRVKIFMTFNPTRTDHPSADLSAPHGGLEALDPETDWEWEAESGYRVFRLDAAQSENVKTGEDLYQGCQTREGFLSFLKKGDRSFDYWVYGRGFWPMQAAFLTIIPMDFLTRNRGEFIFPHRSTNVASADLGFTGDSVIITFGRFGEATGYVSANGEREMFDNGGERMVRIGLQIDQQFEIPREQDSQVLGRKIMETCKTMSVSPEWLAVDRTAIGKGTFDWLANHFGNVLGVGWGEKATEDKILADDKDIPKDLYANISTEMWFAARSWLENGIIKLSSVVPSVPLFSELTNRRFRKRTGSTKIYVESKEEYKARGHQKSPDSADSFVQLVMLCRRRGDMIPTSGGTYKRTRPGPPEKVERVEEIDSLMLEDDEPAYNWQHSVPEGMFHVGN